MSAIALLSVEELKSSVIPGIFSDTSQISDYGSIGGSSESNLSAFQRLMAVPAIGRLSDQISVIVALLVDADPKNVTTAPNWLDRLLGRDVEKVARFENARVSLDEAVLQASKAAESVKATVKGLDDLLKAHQGEVALLDTFITAGREYLSENPTAGLHAQGELEFEKPRDRFTRKITNLSVVRASQDMSAAQMKLARATAIDLLDRLNETTAVLLPVWRHHAMAMTNTKALDPALVMQATHAHQALLRSLQGLDIASAK